MLTPRTLLTGLALALALVGLVTMRAVPADWDVPSYGFPLAYTAFSGFSSLHWDIAVAPLLLDVAVAALITVPASHALLRTLRKNLRPLATALALALAAFAHAATLVTLASGELHPYVLSLPDVGPIACREPWLGEPTQWVAPDQPNCRSAPP